MTLFHFCFYASLMRKKINILRIYKSGVRALQQTNTYQLWIKSQFISSPQRKHFNFEDESKRAQILLSFSSQQMIAAENLWANVKYWSRRRAGQLAIDGERREKCVKLVGVGMSANHDIKSQPPAAHFTTILCTKSQQSRFVALPRQLPHLKKFKSLTERGRGRACNFVSHLRFCGLLLRPKQPSSLNWQVFIRWHILLLVSILRRWRKRRCSIGNSILGRPPPSHPSRAVVGHQPICHLLPPTIPPIPHNCHWRHWRRQCKFFWPV